MRSSASSHGVFRLLAWTTRTHARGLRLLLSHLAVCRGSRAGLRSRSSGPSAAPGSSRTPARANLYLFLRDPIVLHSDLGAVDRGTAVVKKAEETRRSRRSPVRVLVARILGLALIAGAAVALVFAANRYHNTPGTDDAVIAATVVPVSASVPGRVVEVAVADNS